MNRALLELLARRWRRMHYIRDLAFTGGVVCLAATATLLAPTPSRVWWCCVAFAVAFALRVGRSRPWRIDAARIARHLDRTYPDLEESAALFLKTPEQTTLLDRMQRARISSRLAGRAAERRALGTFGMPPRRYLDTTIFWGVGVLVLLSTALWLLWHPPRQVQATASLQGSSETGAVPPPAAPTWPRITGGGLIITPPPYTGRPPRRVDGFNADVEEGAHVAWTMTLDRVVREARLVFGEGPANAVTLDVRASGAGAQLTGTRRVTETGLYHLTATLPDGTVWSPPELLALKVIPDHPPVVRIVDPAPARTEVAPGVPPAPPPRVEVRVEASDDYGIADIRIIATVAKGSGEAVKFRELPLAFETDVTLPDGVTRRLTRTLDLGALGLEPGDELYFFVQAYDNRQPTGNRTRSETRFINLRGPEEPATTTGQGLTGINLVPQYFRSERQIIIDTEKLIADQPTLADRDFRERGNGLGIDQQLLRLRYGQLLGEELESSAGDHAEVNLDPLQRTPPEQMGSPRAAASITQRFLQEHEDQDREGGTEEERESGARPDHPDRPLSAGDVVAPFVDQHDSQDKSTYFDGGTKGTMRDALAAMWDAEKYLRTARPQEALRPEHRALEILKDLQQQARAYVQHVGFEAPPLKVAERRLTGDAHEVPARGSVADARPPGDPAWQAAREALAALTALPPGAVLGADLLVTLKRVEPALTQAATRQPDVFLAGLQGLRRLGAENGRAGDDPGETAALRRALLRLLPPVRPLPERGVEPDPSLGGSYFGALQSAVDADERPRRGRTEDSP